MKWREVGGYDGDCGWIEAETCAGDFVVDEVIQSGQFVAIWYPPRAEKVTEVRIGEYRATGAAKRACRRYAKRMAADFAALAKAGWQ